LGRGSIYENIRIPVDQAPRSTGTKRPYVILNMVESTDGRAAIEGKASMLGTDIDRGVMRTLRSRAHAVMVGGATIRAEKLSLSLDDEDNRPVPRAVILTNSGELPLESNLVLDHRQDVLVLLPESAEKGVERHLGRLAETRRVPATESGAIDVPAALEIMKSSYGIDVLLCEGGPTLNQALITADLADELFVTIAPVLVGTNTPEEPKTFLHGQSGDPKPLRLISSQAVGDELFLRYAIQWYL
jgi:2,5-diamino-6-(ribosylamino)-4(3H)-pyrimidinone 5'-phosphate reductase